MNRKLTICLVVLAVVGAMAASVDAHKKFHHAQPIYEQPHHDQCICDCSRPQPILPNKPYYGNAGYHQPAPHGGSGGYGNAGAYAVSGAYGSGGAQTSGGY